MPHKLGRKPRKFNPRVPHLSALMMGNKSIEAPPPAADWLAAMPANLGMMLNDQLGDCTCAAVYHALQVWTVNTGQHMDTEPDQEVLRLYEQACGYNPNDPNTDQGGDEQHVLTYWKQSGAPLKGPKNPRNKLAAFVEVDPRNHNDVKLMIADCGLVYIGFEVPAYLMAGEPPAVWDLDPSGDNSIIGGHAIILPAYEANDGPLGLISWGSKYKMTWAFFDQFVDEVYALADADWINAKGTTPGGLSIVQLEQQMAGLAMAA